jgi:DNA-binding IscR family transcriptional regulator
MAAVKVSAKSDYAVRALLELAASGEGPVKVSGWRRRSRSR